MSSRFCALAAQPQPLPSGILCTGYFWDVSEEHLRPVCPQAKLLWGPFTFQVSSLLVVALAASCCLPAPTAGHGTLSMVPRTSANTWFLKAFPVPPTLATRPRPSSPLDTGAPHLLSVGADAADKEGLCLSQRLQELVKGRLGKDKQGA